MNEHERIERARRAEQILSDPLMTEAFEHVEAECWRLFREIAPTDLESMQQIKSMQYMHGKYAAFLKRIINDGKMARMELEEKRPRPPGY